MREPKAITNPFPGLRPFETDEYRLFFGREGQSDALIERLQRARFLGVVGTSGSGKSSLVRAGLLPALRGGMMAGAGAGWRVAVMRPGHDPVGNLARVLAEEGVLAELGAGLARAEAEAVVEATLRRGSLGLVDAVRQARLGEREKLLVVVDQFEELFRFRAARATTDTDDDASAFVKLLLESKQTDKPPEERLPIYVVLTMRSDFLGDCAQFQGLPEAINDGQYLIPRMTRDERQFAISGPVRVARGKMSEPLVNRLLNDVGDNPDQLPILQHALMRTWDYWQQHRSDGEPIGLEHYTAVGTMTDALSLHAEEAWAELTDERSRRIAELLFKALTERGADNREIRRPISLREICSIAGAREEEVIAVIEVFRREGRSFLMPPVGVELRPETVIDISHESLIRNWQRLKKWVTEEAISARTYRRLADAAVLHREGREGLMQDPGLQIAFEWLVETKPNATWGHRYHPEFSEALSYLKESREAREAALAEKERQREEQLARERRELEQAQAFAEQQTQAAQRLRRQRFSLAFISLFALVMAGGAAYAYSMAQKAKAANDKFRDAVVLAQRGSYERADDLFVSAIEGYQSKTLSDHEAEADALVERGHLKFLRGYTLFVRKGGHSKMDQKIQSDLDGLVKHYDDAAQIYADINATGKAGASLFSLGNILMKFTSDVPAVTGTSRDELSEMLVSKSAESEAPDLSDTEKRVEVAQQSLGDVKPPGELRVMAVKRFEGALDYYQQVYERLLSAKGNNAEDPDVVRADTGRKNSAFQAADISMREANRIEDYEGPKEEVAGLRRKAVSHFERMLGFYKGLDSAKYPRILVWLGGLHRDLGDIPDSEKYFEQAIDAYAGLHEKRNDALGAMAEIAEGAGQLNAALALHYRALDEARKATGGDLLGEANAQYGLGRVWEAKSGETSFDEAVKYYRQAVVTYKATSLEPRKSGPLAKNLLHIGVVARGINEYDFAIEAYDLAASFTKDATQENFKQDRARALAEIGAIRVAMNQTRRALASYQSALEIYRTLATDSLSVEDSKEDAEEEVERIDKIIKSLSKGGWKPPGAR